MASYNYAHDNDNYNQMFYKLQLLKNQRKKFKKLIINAELYKCQKDGNCSEADKAKYQEIYQTCGNLGRKFEILEEQMDTLYTEAREIRDKEGLAWSEAIRLAVKEQRART